jgi:lipopolysaccharide export system protein LptA
MKKELSLTIIKIILLTALTSSYLSVFALTSDTDKPVQISAEHGEANQQNQTTMLSNNVTIIRGSITINADRGTVALDKNGDKLITLWGSPIRFSQRQDNGEMISGQCNLFNYNTKTNLAILQGRAKMKKGSDQISGETISYNTQSQIYSANGVAANGINKKQRAGRITIILNNLEKQHAK